MSPFEKNVTYFHFELSVNLEKRTAPLNEKIYTCTLPAAPSNRIKTCIVSEHEKAKNVNRKEAFQERNVADFFCAEELLGGAWLITLLL